MTIQPVSAIEKNDLLPQQSVSGVHLEALFEQHLQAPLKPIGETIIEGAQNIRTTLNQQSTEIQARIEASPEMTLPELIRIQSDLSRMVLFEETLARTVSKSTQNIDTLLKSQ